MTKILLILFFIAFMQFEQLSAQPDKIPHRITITDKFFSPFGLRLHYDYELSLNGDSYLVQRTFREENGRKSYIKKHIGTINRNLIQAILYEISNNPANEIKPGDFQHMFPLDSIIRFFENEGDNYWITNEYQREFIIEQLTVPDNLKNNLQWYFQNFDHSEYIDGPSTEMDIKFHFYDSILSINSKSILWCGLPFEINNSKNYSPKLATLIGKLIPDSRTKRKEQFSADKLFSVVINKTISHHRRRIDNLESKSYQVYIDSLKNRFFVSNIRVVNGTSSVNWNGEKRLSCKLRDSSMTSNVSISYSVAIENAAIKYPVALILSDYGQLFKTIENSSFFREYLSGNKERELLIIYDDNSCFTEKSRNAVGSKCVLANTTLNPNNAVFISLQNEFGNISRWVLLANGQYFMWWNNGNPPVPSDDENFLRCE